jgi:hypothetical protein
MFSSVSANNSTAPDGTTTADLLVEDSSTSGRYLQQAITTTAQTYTFSVYLKMPSSNARRYALLYHNESVKGWVFDLQSGVVGAGGTTAVGAPAAYGIESVGSGWYRCYITITGTAASNQFRIYPVTNNGSGNASYTGDGVSGILVWGAQIETGSSATAYQKVGLTSDVTESGKRDCWGLLFDGSDDSLVTASVDFSATDKMTVMAGVRKSSDAARGTIVEHGDSWQTVNGSFAIEAPAGTGANDYRLVSKGTSSNSQTLTTYAAPITNVITLQGNISAPSLIGRVNGTQVVSSTASQGTGNYTSQVILIGRRPSGPLQFNGILYTLIVRGATTPTGTIADFERNLLARRCGVTF